jgi:hypothetical protein
MADKIKDRILSVYKNLECDQNHRYRSWEHCFQHFRNHADFKNSEQIDTAALHLGFYLASWGMYRGSGFLLSKDYKIHSSIVAKLLKKEYLSLWNLCFDKPEEVNKAIEVIVSLSNELKTIYRPYAMSGKGKSKKVSDTLVTKILLGTFGCTPALDRYFILGFRHITELPEPRLSKNFLNEVLSFYQKHPEEFADAQSRISKLGGIRYPIMKLIDMYFWETGFMLDPKGTDD